MNKLLISFILIALVSNSYAQVSTDGRRNVVTSAVPFLTITPDSRSGAMGDAGVALPGQNNLIHWNPAKLAFLNDPFGMSISYTPWLKNLVNDISLSYLSGYKKIDNVSGFGGSLRYFTLGSITFTNDQGKEFAQVEPNEFALDGAYGRKLSENFSVGVALRFIYSNLNGGISAPGSTSPTRAGVTFAGDLSCYYNKKDITVKGYKADWAFGANISNLGGKISYIKDQNADFLPTNLKVGGYFNFKIDEHNEIAITADLNKLLIPTMPVYFDSTFQGEAVIAQGFSPDVSVTQGIVQSFYDAPGGFKEEMREINRSIGLEYWYSQTLALRTGYFYEHYTKGNRQYLTAGVGIKYNTMLIDFSYLLDTSGRHSTGISPLANTIRFSICFNFNKAEKKELEPNS